MSDVFSTLMEINEKLGSLQTECRNTNLLITQHVADDKLVEQRVTVIELDRARQRGSVKVLGSLAAGFGAIVGALFGPTAAEWVSHLFSRPH